MTEDTFLPIFDIASIATSLFLLSAYLIAYQVAVYDSRIAASTQTGRNYRNMVLWAEKHNVHPDAPSVTLAVQTLRNTILVGVFIGGSSLTSAVSALDILAMQAPVPPQLLVRQIIVSGLLFLSFLNWTQVIRFANHIGFYVGTLDTHVAHANEMRTQKELRLRAEQQQEETLSSSGGDGNAAACPEEFATGKPPTTTLMMQTEQQAEHNIYDTEHLSDLKSMANKLTTHFSWGLRFLYITIPFWMYIAGPVALVVACGVTLSLLILFDFPTITKRSHDKKG